jgi:hypothetical protein
MTDEQRKKIIKELKDALTYEEDALIKVQQECFRHLPGNFNDQELEKAVSLLESIIIQSLGHVNILSSLIVKHYEESGKEL